MCMCFVCMVDAFRKSHFEVKCVKRNVLIESAKRLSAIIVQRGALFGCFRREKTLIDIYRNIFCLAQYMTAMK